MGLFACLGGLGGGQPGERRHPIKAGLKEQLVPFAQAEQPRLTRDEGFPLSSAAATAQGIPAAFLTGRIHPGGFVEEALLKR